MGNFTGLRRALKNGIRYVFHSGMDVVTSAEESMTRFKRKRRRPSRRTLLKIRAIPLVRMPKSVFFHKIRQACRDGIVPSDIEITTLNWDHVQGKRYMPGSELSGSDADELRNCYNLLAGVGKQDVRFERPS